MNRPRFRPLLALAAAAPLALAGCSSVGADDSGADWTPRKPIEITAPAATGGGWDTLARTSERILTEEKIVDKQIRVVNKPGGGGSIGWAYIANNAGDPHKLFVTSPPILLVPLSGVSEHDHTDFTPIAQLATDYMVYLVPADSELKTFGDVVDKLKDNPGALSLAGGSSPGSMDHVAVAGALHKAGVEAGKTKYVPFDGGGEAMTSLLGGHVDVAVSGAGEAQGLIKSGKLRALAVSSSEPIDALPDVPTLTESGIDYTFDIWRGVMGPADMTDGQVAYYENAFRKLTDSSAWKKEAARLGWTESFQGSDEFGAFLKKQNDELAAVLSEVGLRKG